MKKLFALILCLLMIITLSACGSKAAGPDTATAAPAQVPADTPTKAPTDAPTETPTETPAEADFGFDTAWASNEYEALLPQLPFTGWTTSEEGNGVYKMELGGLKDQILTDDSGNKIGYGEDKQALIDYLESLKDYGFSVEETGGIEGYEYQWEASDAQGNTFEFLCAEGYCWITITKKN